MSVPGQAANRERQVDAQQLPEFEADIADTRRGEALQCRGNLVSPRPQRGKPVHAIRVRRRALYADERGAARFDGDAGHHGFRGVADGAFDRSALFLRRD
jgi:hypothetical protein